MNYLLLKEMGYEIGVDTKLLKVTGKIAGPVIIALLTMGSIKSQPDNIQDYKEQSYKCTSYKKLHYHKL